jgi:hypothetical protein
MSYKPVALLLVALLAISGAAQVIPAPCQPVQEDLTSSQKAKQ